MFLGRLLRHVLGRQQTEPDEPAGTEQAMKLIVGLGNPGRPYAGTRHNVGYEALDRLAEKYGPASFRGQFQGQLARLALGGQALWLLKPETYMNRSGRSVQPALAYYGLSPSDLLVVCDDLNLPVGKLRVRRQGSHGGQKGLLSIGEALGTTEFARLRIGIGRPPEQRAWSDYVLARPKGDEREAIDRSLDRAAEAAIVWARDGVEACMRQFNAGNPSESEPR